MNFFKNLFGKKSASAKPAADKKAENKDVQMGCDCSGCPSAGDCPGEEMKKAVEESKEE